MKLRHFFAAALVCITSACSASTAVPAFAPLKNFASLGAAQSSKCPGPSSGNNLVASVKVTLTAAFSLGKATQVPVSVQGYDIGGNPITGTFKHPLLIKLSDTSAGRPHVKLDCTTIYSSKQRAPVLSFDGHGDSIDLTVSARGIHPVTLAFATTLPPEILLAKPHTEANPTGENAPFGSIAFGTDGKIWTAMSRVVRSNNTIPVYASITTSGKVETYIVHDRGQWPDDFGGSPRCILGADKQMWCTADRVGETATIINRISTTGAITKIEVPPFYYATSMALDKAGRMWLATTYGDFLTIGPGGKVRQVAKIGESASNLVRDPQNRGMWFSTSTRIGMITPVGKIRQYKIAGVSGRWNWIGFFLGPDGNFWAPWIDHQWSLVKIDLNGKVVSSAPIAHQPSTTPPFFGQYAQDNRGNTYVAGRTGGNTITRFASDGTISSYDTIGTGVAGLAIASGTLYATDLVQFQNGYKSAGGLVVVDTSQW